ncbi:conserved hypothetical protein [Bosea sp. 62]|uniref:DUF1127 domain-containing protein n=1 Tax=unclassified Bosea (in: a-proteobacteria) TaxID=2653178 RepID=UPI0012541E8C|nr:MULTISPECIES: DUF1127 domain-containing protein [unclassified Bosea (in: a-proteobacteria)]CAD5258324.1 conserved hypothetical protein [Bosea sp. 46]CAD5262769.1 conserved hypothetical protein [Bosea sp. 21B]CAD5277654.1 conserved hypothetical protein [Bosea sp. 7B]VVT58811.1 conserved hypothetical protein [Bosea sp. EC-HK365B]VXB60986.1 conserved hypothetical protein [Bosea sp. 29B]
MNDAPTLASHADHTGTAGPRGILATWRERIRVRWKLAQMAQENPHLLKDIGLTKQRVEMEIAKPFWRR